MPRLTTINWKKFERFLLYVGCKYKRQEGSHRVYWREGLARPIVLPTYKDLPVFIIRNNLRLLGISVMEYLSILRKIK